MVVVSSLTIPYPGLLEDDEKGSEKDLLKGFKHLTELTCVFDKSTVKPDNRLCYIMDKQKGRYFYNYIWIYFMLLI